MHIFLEVENFRHRKNVLENFQKFITQERRIRNKNVMTKSYKKLRKLSFIYYIKLSDLDSWGVKSENYFQWKILGR